MVLVLLAAFVASLPMQSASTPAPTTPAPTAGPLSSLGLESRPPPIEAEVATARREADAIAAAAHADAWFENVTTTASPALKHKASGLVCTFVSGSPINRLLLFKPPGGDSFGCNTSRGPRSYSVFLDRAPPGRPPVEQLIGPLAGAIVKRFPEAKPLNPVLVASGQDDRGGALPPHKVAQFTRPTPRGDAEERLAVVYVGDWFLQQRITEPAADNTAADLLNELSFLSDQRAITAASATSPVAAGSASDTPSHTKK